MQRKKPMRNYFRVISSPRAIRKITGFHSKNPKPLCNQCKQRVHKITHDLGDIIAKRLEATRFNHLGFWCDFDLHFFSLLPVLQPDRDTCIELGHKLYTLSIDRSKRIADEANIDRFDKIGEWCYDCQRFDQTKMRRVTIEKRDKSGE